MASGPVTPRQALLTALAGVTALENSMYPEVKEMGREDVTGDSFAAAVALAARMMDEVRRLGGDPGDLMRRVYLAATDLAPS